MVVSKTDTMEKSVEGGAVIKGGSLAPQPLDVDFASRVEEALGYADLENVSKSTLTRIEISQLPKEIPDFQAPGATKDTLIAEWLRNWIVDSVKAGNLSECHLLPKKGDIATYLGVSVGTVQNAIRYIEDEGHVESKQRIGTLIRNAEASGPRMRKQTSKRDQAVVAIQQFIVENKYEPGQTLPSAREIAKTIRSAPNTTRLALEFLSSQGVLKSLGNRGNKANWALREIPKLDCENVCEIESETLIDQLERDLKKLIAESFEIGDKLPSHLELSDVFKVSIKTVHDAMKRLSDQGIIRSKRGRYGTYVMRKPDASKFFSPVDTSIFVPAEEVSFYNYEKVEQHLKQMIKQHYKVGDKLPAMGVLSKELDVSSNTIRKALQNLAKEKLVTFSRGRYGGTYVNRVPEVKEAESGKPFTWVSINPDTVKTYRTGKTK